MERFVKNKTFELILSLIFPHRCRLCGVSVKPFKCVCDVCSDKIERIGGNFCLKCGCNIEKCICSRSEHLYSGVIAPFVYTGSVKNGIHLWKFGGNIDSTQYFAATTAEEVKNKININDYDYITFVPQTESEKENRGYNQAELFAKVFGAYFDREPVELLEKIFETQRQRNLPEILRTGNVMGVFGVKEPKKIDGKKIIIVDDIKTTGSVLNECAKMLLIHGADEVLCVCIAVVEKEK